jgi:hypothetical protein
VKNTNLVKTQQLLQRGYANRLMKRRRARAIKATRLLGRIETILPFTLADATLPPSLRAVSSAAS